MKTARKLKAGKQDNRGWGSVQQGIRRHGVSEISNPSALLGIGIEQGMLNDEV
jgi:hypothetical protein